MSQTKKNRNVIDKEKTCNIMEAACKCKGNFCMNLRDNNSKAINCKMNCRFYVISKCNSFRKICCSGIQSSSGRPQAFSLQMLYMPCRLRPLQSSSKALSKHLFQFFYSISAISVIRLKNESSTFRDKKSASLTSTL